jgi:SAM-dependent methyltransferase
MLSPNSPDAHDDLCWGLVTTCQDEVGTSDPHPYYLQAYRQAESTYWRQIPGWIARDVARRRPRHCLDIGCAYGTLLLYVRKLTACSAYGIDFVANYLSPALITRNDICFAVNNVELDPFPWPLHYDVIILTEVLEHFNFHPVPTLQKIRNLLVDDGALYLSTPDASQWGRTTKYYTKLADIPPPAPELHHRVVDDHVWQYTESELREVLEAADLRIRRFDYSSGVVFRHFNLTLERR